jgi:hypothetical protein
MLPGESLPHSARERFAWPPGLLAIRLKEKEDRGRYSSF